MKALLCSLLFATTLVPAVLNAQTQTPAEKKPFVLYAEFLGETPVELSDGSSWVMDKGDCFPVYMFKEHQTRVVLTLASATFTTDSTKVRILKETDRERALESYRKNVDNFLKTQSEAWKKGKAK